MRSIRNFTPLLCLLSSPHQNHDFLRNCHRPSLLSYSKATATLQGFCINYSPSQTSVFCLPATFLPLRNNTINYCRLFGCEKRWSLADNSTSRKQRLHLKTWWQPSGWQDLKGCRASWVKKRGLWKRPRQTGFHSWLALEITHSYTLASWPLRWGNRHD